MKQFKSIEKEKMIMLETIIGTIIGTILAGIIAEKRFSVLAKIRNKYYQRRNSRIERKAEKKAQAILDKKVTRDELLSMINTISEISADLKEITELTLCIVIQIINDPSKEALANYMRSRGLKPNYDSDNIENWIQYLWNRNTTGGDTGKIKDLQLNINKLKNSMDTLDEVEINIRSRSSSE